MLNIISFLHLKPLFKSILNVWLGNRSVQPVFKKETVDGLKFIESVL